VDVDRKALFTCLEKQLIELHLTALLQKGQFSASFKFCFVFNFYRPDALPGAQPTVSKH